MAILAEIQKKCKAGLAMVGTFQTVMMLTD
jgi:hypothetical protein